MPLTPDGPRRLDPIPAETNRVSGSIVEAALAVHRSLGPGLLEGVYEECLAIELRRRGLRVARQVFVPVTYAGVSVEYSLRMDMLVENAVGVELKSARAITDLDRAQLLTYLRLSGKRLGLLLNFNVVLLRHGVLRVVS